MPTFQQVTFMFQNTLDVFFFKIFLKIREIATSLPILLFVVKRGLKMTKQGQEARHRQFSLLGWTKARTPSRGHSEL